MGALGAPVANMQPIWIIRLLFVLTLTLCGYWIGRSSATGLEFSATAFVLGLFIVAVEYATRILSTKRIVLGIIGAFFGLAFSRLFYDTFPREMFPEPQASLTAFNLLFMYFGIVVALRNADRISLNRLRFFVTSPKEDSILLDTSVIIDGRIRDLYLMGFLSKNAIVPTFVLDELQALADSRDAGKRHNGRKGLENLDEFKEVAPMQIFEKDYPDQNGVDQKLISLAKEIGAWMLTNDYNLAKVAALHNIRVMNLNQVAAALRPTITVGDQVVIQLTREGKDPGQGVGHLEDGSMVVVDDAKEQIGELIPVTIVSMMHTNAGRLVFGRKLDDSMEAMTPRPLAETPEATAPTSN